MSFTFAARTLLELGKELISSDAVALQELIKNAVDAQSPRVELIANVQLRHSDFREAIFRIVEEQKNASEVIPFVRSKLLDSNNDAFKSSLDVIGAHSQTDALVAKLTTLYEDLNYIEVRDTGHGMGLRDLSDVFLRIGTSSRRKANLAGARNLGDKGIGRLSAMRLGNRLQVKTARTEDRHWNLLYIDWTLFSHDDDVDADAINIEPQIGEEKANADDRGTTIRISALQGDWDLPRFTDILQGRIARMIDPFVPGLANRLIVARHNGVKVAGTIHSPSTPTGCACHVPCRI